MPVLVGGVSAQSLEKSVSDSELEAYATARPQVRDIKDFWADQIQSSSPRAAEDLREVRQSEIERTVNMEGLTIERYEFIHSLVQDDNDIQERLGSIND